MPIALRAFLPVQPYAHRPRPSARQVAPLPFLTLRS